jgi:hypothetical protein
VTDGRYTLTELGFARRKWPTPTGRVLPVMVRKTPLDHIPPYLKALTILESAGNIAAETSAAVDQMRAASSVAFYRKVLIALVPFCVILGMVMLPFLHGNVEARKEPPWNISGNWGNSTGQPFKITQKGNQFDFLPTGCRFRSIADSHSGALRTAFR